MVKFLKLLGEGLFKGSLFMLVLCIVIAIFIFGMMNGAEYLSNYMDVDIRLLAVGVMVVEIIIFFGIFYAIEEYR